MEGLPEASAEHQGEQLRPGRAVHNGGERSVVCKEGTGLKNGGRGQIKKIVQKRKKNGPIKTGAFL